MSEDDEVEVPVAESEPIDADFEPAADAPDAPRSGAGSGPGWLGVGIASLMAAGVGAAIGISANLVRPAGPGGDVAALTQEIATLKADLETAGLERGKIARDTTEIESRLQAGLQNSAGSSNGEDLRPLVAELDAVSRRLDEAMASGGGAAIAKLTARLDALEAVDTSGQASPQELSRAIAALAERMNAVELGIANLRADVAADDGPDTSNITGLIETMRKDEAAVRAKAESSATNADAALALAAIEAASRRGDAFESDYRRLRVILPKVQAVRALGVVASTGAPTLAELQQTFKPASVAARKAEPARERSGLGWLNSVFGDAVTVSRADGEAETAAGTLSRARQALDAGDLAGAVAIVGQLSGAPATAMADWTESANRRITLEAGLEELRFSLIDGEQ
ncbi:COG4223 family protein [Hyphomonas johnsonii]|uniref:Mitochondrial inner membrane protein n=1 Tax=Hyphomonas johnsonii MHS-2 TaxID=1280950 RepID=A0A059FLX2_9PROT|nr:hypothetical protein [Hyphomonas johnsonii]KCZ91597.1 hypothetical protein HJO_10787 [Hyphomonas johnsonii MHS-2]